LSACSSLTPSFFLWSVHLKMSFGGNYEQLLVIWSLPQKQRPIEQPLRLLLQACIEVIVIEDGIEDEHVVSMAYVAPERIKSE